MRAADTHTHTHRTTTVTLAAHACRGLMRAHVGAAETCSVGAYINYSTMNSTKVQNPRPTPYGNLSGLDIASKLESVVSLPQLGQHK